jgi:hypothetical protein
MIFSQIGWILEKKIQIQPVNTLLKNIPDNFVVHSEISTFVSF